MLLRRYREAAGLTQETLAQRAGLSARGISDLERGARQFQDNLGRLLGKYQSAGIPVLIGTLVSNERDQAPLAVLSGAETDAAGAADRAVGSLLGPALGSSCEHAGAAAWLCPHR